MNSVTPCRSSSAWPPVRPNNSPRAPPPPDVAQKAAAATAESAQLSAQIFLDNAAALPAPVPQPQDLAAQQEIAAAQQVRNLDRSNRELQQRSKSAQIYAQNQWSANQMAQRLEPPAAAATRAGAMRARWVGDKLILARRVESGGAIAVQGCWLDWPVIRAALWNEVRDLLPEGTLQPITDDAPDPTAWQLATLPVRLVVDSDRLVERLGLASAAPPDRPISGLRLSLAIAWIGLVIGLAAIALLLQGVIRMSERRAAFVSAVTHELRTPLTTFRMYAEMLAERMVPTPHQQQQYAETMKVEADRLAHLVENVLQLARLERGRRPRRIPPQSIASLIERSQGRLEARAAQAGMQLACDLPEDVARGWVAADPASIEQILFNLVENACKYARGGSDPTIHVINRSAGGWWRVTVRDHGPGIDPRMRRKLFQAFCKSDQEAAETAQGVGLGLALCRRMARDLGGTLTLERSPPGAGAAFTLALPQVDGRG